MKRLFGLVLVVFVGISLGGCASLERWCGHEVEKEQIMATQRQPEAVRPTPPPAPPAAKPLPPKKDRN